MKRNLTMMLLCVVVAACSSPESGFEAARKQGTAAAYLAFVDKYPDHELARQARTEAARLEWEAIRDGGDSTTAVLDDYLQRYPDTSYRPEAEDLLVEFACAEARSQDSAEAWRGFVTRFPDSRYEVEALDAVLATYESTDSLQYEETLATSSGLMQYARDGSIKNYPEGTTISITITDNDSEASYTSSGLYVSMVEEFGVFELENGDFYLRLPSGYLTPCICTGYVPAAPADAATAEQVYELWRIQRLQQAVAFVQENAGTADREIISIIGALQLPHAQREIAELQTSADSGTRELAQRYAEVSGRIKAQVCP